MGGFAEGQHGGARDASTTLALWSDDPARVDLLSFDAVAHTLADGLLDPAVDPVALGLSGSWGSGKSTVLGLIEAELGRRTTAEDKVLVVSTQPWRYDPATGAKESLISEILAELAAEVQATSTSTSKAKDLLIRLRKRVDWAQAVKLAGTSALTLQIPDFEKLVDLVKPKDGDKDTVRGLGSFRDEFRDLLASDELSHVRAVAVLVDDLDRCLPETVVDTLEAMRLFLSVPKMSFVIAADEARVADAIRTRFKTSGRPEVGDDIAIHETPQDPATLYLHKIVQTTIPLPALSNFETQSYLLLLLLKARAGTDGYTRLVERCVQVRRDGGTMEDIGTIESLEIDDEVAFAARLTPLLYEKLRGNPRYIKRFLNDLHVRRAVAQRRGIDLDTSVIAKLMTLELLMPVEFQLVLDWFSRGVMRPRLTQLEERAGQSTGDPSVDDEPDRDGDHGSKHAGDSADPGELSAAMLRWATLAPPLRGLELAPYLTLAASFAGVTLLDDSLPERLRDIAANLLSESRIKQTSVTDAIMAEVGPGGATDLVRYLGRAIRDQPSRQKAGVNAVLRLARQYPTIAAAARDALRMLPARDLTIATPVQFKADDAPELREVLRHWRERRPNETRADDAIRRALQTAMRDTRKA